VTRTTENVTYQSSRTVKKMRLPAGSVRRLSVSVLVDQEVTWEKNGAAFKRVLVPPAPEKLKVIRDLVAGITGFSEERGDQLIIETLPFELTLLTSRPGPRQRDHRRRRPRDRRVTGAGFAVPIDPEADGYRR
jgi:flagellar M-ring protein FliF